MNSVMSIGLVAVLSAVSAFAQTINPLDYFPLKEGKVWKYNGMFVNGKGIKHKYHFTIEVQGVQQVKGGTSFTLYRSSYGSGPNDEPELLEYRDRGLVDTSNGLSILREQMKTGDSWQALSKEGRVQGKATVLRLNYSEVIGKVTMKDCIKMLIENNVYEFVEEITFSKNIGPIKMDRFQSMEDYKKHKLSASDLIRLSK